MHARPPTPPEWRSGASSRGAVYEYATRTYRLAVEGRIKARLHVWSGDECVQVHR